MEVIAEALLWFKNTLSVCIFIVVILSWFPVNRSHPLYRLLLAITDPILQPIRKALYNSPIGGPGMMIDFSPFIAMVLLQVVYNIIASLILAL
ncbi:MAG: YggT family protein [Clostridiales bacterium]|nr:YggT family protein [Clostridiales bacterium]